MATNESEALEQLAGALVKLESLKNTAHATLVASQQRLEELEEENARLRKENSELKSEVARLNAIDSR